MTELQIRIIKRISINITSTQWISIVHLLKPNIFTLTLKPYATKLNFSVTQALDYEKVSLIEFNPSELQ